MFDLKAIRDNPKSYDENWARRGLEPQTPEILALDETRRRYQTEMQTLQNERKTKSAEIGKIKSQGGDADALMKEVYELKDKIAELEAAEEQAANDLHALLSALPNQLDADVPEGEDETQNVEVRRWGAPKEFEGEHPDHVTIGEALGLMDFETAAKMSGSRFVILKGKLARLERALAQFMLDVQTEEHGYEEVSPPLMVRDSALFGTSQLPKFEEDQFKTTREDYLIPTSEVPLTNMAAEQILDDAALPLRYTAHTPCFRQEAGSAGRDTRGMIRMHQFYKVELVSIVHPESSEEELERKTKCAEDILKRLELPYRTMTLCSGDIGFSARKTYDLEVWIPSQNTYREISSCSNCGDFQARRMKARFRKQGEKETHFVHTLNGSGLAVGRALVAVIENYYDPETQSIRVPEALKKYNLGFDIIEKPRL